MAHDTSRMDVFFTGQQHFSLLSLVENWPVPLRCVVATVRLDSLPLHPVADCLLVAGDDHDAATADLARLALPVMLAVRVGTEVDPRLADQAVGYLFDDDPADVMAEAIALAVLGARDQVRDAGGTSQRISALSAEAARIAEALARLARTDGVDAVEQPVTAALVRRIVRLRRDRERFFPAEIFADPAWDMLLDLTAARLEGQKVPVSSLCVAAAVPTTTAPRWIRSLTEAGIFERRSDPFNARRAFVHLSTPATDGVLAYLRLFNQAFAMR